MKLSEVPMDDANVLEGKTSFVQYAVDDEGKYVRAKSPGFKPQNIALQQAWEEVDENISAAAELVLNNEKSPIYFFMHKEIMDVRILAEYVNMPRWRVKRHLNPSNFNKLSDDILQRYVNIFKLENIDDLKHFDINKWTLKK
jgi:hypothetical protein